MGIPADPSQIDHKSALTSARLFLATMQRNLGAVPAGTEDLFTGDVIDQPMLISDLNGIPLFYDFPVNSAGAAAGCVRVAATKLLGYPWISISTEPVFDPGAVLTEAVQAIRRTMPGCKLVDHLPVCHRYPAVGLLLTIKTPANDVIARLYDPERLPQELVEIPEGGDAGPDSTEGSGAYSILSSLPEGGDPEEEFDQFERILDDMLSEARSHTDIPAHFTRNDLNAEQLGRLVGWNAGQRPEGEAREKILDVDQIQQKGSVYCVLASIQMIAGFQGVGPLPDQDSMAHVLEDPPPLFTPSGGILPSNQVASFQRFFPATTDINLDASPTWQEFISEIDASRPFKSGITGHARVARGYQSTQIGAVSGSPTVIQRSLWINDPSKSAGLTLEPHEIATLSGDGSVVSTTPRIPIKNNSINVRTA